MLHAELHALQTLEACYPQAGVSETYPLGWNWSQIHPMAFSRRLQQSNQQKNLRSSHLMGLRTSDLETCRHKAP